MLRSGAWALAHALRRSRAAGGPLRAFTASGPAREDEAAKKVDKDAFLESFVKLAPSTMNPPHFSIDWQKEKGEKEAEAPAAGVPTKLKLNFYMPNGVLCKGEEVDLALIPAVTGDFGVMPGHVPTVAQLRPGIVAVHKEMDKDVKKYFVSSGFAFVHADSTADVCAVEAVQVEDLDPEAVKAGLAEYTAKLGALQGKGDDYEIAAAQIGLEVYSAMNAAIPS
ncbi:unnamed protein product [Ostreobium quekettii]|uniref:ATP synthase F1 complex delta/epsilon subunit N-terminal domain-containing protein n=1 Tax=Ostreobium quekettii TaxID=121088 RepID=A0A8S1J7L6_9CHLO|nr:unnamed protein product [Ostreobium quekettii]